MNAFKKILRYWLTLSSFIGFLVGWVFVARSSETGFVENAITANPSVNQTRSLPSIPSIDSLVGTTDHGQAGSVQSFTVTRSTNSFSGFMPSMRTGGS
jgi:hypothetical protein